MGVDINDAQREKHIRRRMNATTSNNMAKPGVTTHTLTYVGDDKIQEECENDSKGEADGGYELSYVKSQDADKLYMRGEDDAHPRLPLPRLPTCAVFHKLTGGKGVPHTFYAFLRQWPALPRVVVSLPCITDVPCLSSSLCVA